MLVCSLLSLHTSPVLVFFAPLFPLLPSLCRYLLPLRVVFVRKTAVVLILLFCPCNSSYLLRVVLPVQQESVPLQHVWRSSGHCSLSFPLRSSCITFSRAPVVFFALLSFYFSSSFVLLFFFFFPFFSLYLWSGLFCCVLVPGTLALRLLCLDELRLFGLL